MSRSARLTGPDLIRALQTAGFEVKGTKGSHYMLAHDDGRRTVVVPDVKSTSVQRRPRASTQLRIFFSITGRRKRLGYEGKFSSLDFAVIIGMAADPKPKQPIFNVDSKGSVMQANPN